MDSLLDGSRRESAAEHSWHLAHYALLLHDPFARPADPGPRAPDAPRSRHRRGRRRRRCLWPSTRASPFGSRPHGRRRVRRGSARPAKRSSGATSPRDPTRPSEAPPDPGRDRRGPPFGQNPSSPSRSLREFIARAKGGPRFVPTHPTDDRDYRLRPVSSVLVAGERFLFLGFRRYLHGWARSPRCARPLRRSRTDGVATYHPGRRCEVAWTCGCHEQADRA